MREQTRILDGVEQIIGTSVAITRVVEDVERVAATDSTVLLLGETGTGKELVARAIHNFSGRSSGTLVTVNCAALPSGLIESELFGYEVGAFTGAVSRKIGRFEMSDGATIFLDEIGDLLLELQAKLLRVLQDGEFERVGGAETVKVDARVIAATNQDLEEAIQAQRFRADLYYRLNVFPILMPPLRNRKEDIPLLVRHFVSEFSGKIDKQIAGIPQATLEALLSYAWPGNVRELRNVIERAVIVSRGSELELGEWPPTRTLENDKARILTLEEHEREHIVKVLELTNWRVSGDKGAAEILGMRPTTLESRMKKLGIVRER